MSGISSVTNATCIDDLRKVALRRVPRAFFQYADHGSYSQSTLRANRTGLNSIRLRQRVGIDVGNRDLATTIVGEPAALPLILAPVGLCGMQCGDGEILACRAAQAAGIPFCLSTMSICSIEEVAAAVGQPFWFQLYMMRDRGFVRALAERAIAARCSALVVTLDLNVLGQRHCDIKNGLAVPPRITPGNVLSVAARPAWALGILRGKRRNFGNLAGHITVGDSVTTLAQWTATQFDPTLSWADLEWVRGIWPGKIILKGITDPEDARIAASTGASAIVVSNHGGRQLDGAPPAISALPRIAEAVGSDVELIFDSGIRSGQDVLRALALGARSCMIGRAYLYGLGAGGQRGAAKAIEIIRRELDVSMALTGTRSVRDAGPQLIAEAGVSPVRGTRQGPAA
ncbi:MAG: alpha-hydroxy acid oxidase [Streptosporangiaceae bacterium]